MRAIEGLDVLDESLVGAPGVHGYDPLRLAIDVRGTGASGYELARRCASATEVILELAGENVIVCVFGMAEDGRAPGPAADRRPARVAGVAGRPRRPHA